MIGKILTVRVYIHTIKSEMKIKLSSDNIVYYSDSLNIPTFSLRFLAISVTSSDF